MLRTLKDIRSYVHRQDDRRLSGKTVGTVDMAQASCLCLQNEENKEGKEESHWELSSHTALTQTFTVALARATHP